MTSVKTLSVRCPTCSDEVIMTAKSPHRPFCSKRCKLIDLGEWASESYSIPSEDSPAASEFEDK